MPRSITQILEHADVLAAEAFERYEPREKDERPAGSYHALERAVRDRAAAERAILEAIAAMRREGWSWASVGGVLGTSGQAAQQRYGRLLRDSD